MGFSVRLQLQLPAIQVRPRTTDTVQGMLEKSRVRVPSIHYGESLIKYTYSRLRLRRYGMGLKTSSGSMFSPLVDQGMISDWSINLNGSSTHHSDPRQRSYAGPNAADITAFCCSHTSPKVMAPCTQRSDLQAASPSIASTPSSAAHYIPRYFLERTAKLPIGAGHDAEISGAIRLTAYL